MTVGLQAVYRPKQNCVLIVIADGVSVVPFFNQASSTSSQKRGLTFECIRFLMAGECQTFVSPAEHSPAASRVHCLDLRLKSRTRWPECYQHEAVIERRALSHLIRANNAGL